jgi:UDP-N-acetyl-D-galactosamine dehydrogenase
VVDVIAELRDYGVEVDVHDPWVDANEASTEYGINLSDTPQAGAYDGIILAVAHGEFRRMGVDAFRALGRENHVIYDLKSVVEAADVDCRL